jgi:metal-responsive CopG/Arc/MetJ family transcriptional regulator
MNKAKTVSLPTSLLKQVDQVRRERRDPTVSDTVRVLLLQALGAMNYLRPSEKKALGMKLQVVKRENGKN